MQVNASIDGFSPPPVTYLLVLKQEVLYFEEELVERTANQVKSVLRSFGVYTLITLKGVVLFDLRESKHIHLCMD